MKKDARILLFAGDVDMACNFLGGEEFVDALGKGWKINFARNVDVR